MVKKTLIYIFIYTLLVGCNTQNPLNSECESNCFLNVEASSLQMDENGYYHIEWLEGYNQTFSTLDANTGSTFLSVWEVMITDTITVYAGYYDECNIEHMDSIKVIVEDEI